MDVLTIGYEGLSIPVFLSLLAAHSVDTVVDVRALPVSRKPGFSKAPLRDHLRLSGYSYLHVQELGCPKSIRDRYRQDGDRTRYRERFLRYLKQHTDAVADLAALAKESHCALLCFEADPDHCHRSLVAGALRRDHNARVTHIQTTAHNHQLQLAWR